MGKRGPKQSKVTVSIPPFDDQLLYEFAHGIVVTKNQFDWGRISAAQAACKIIVLAEELPKLRELDDSRPKQKKKKAKQLLPLLGLLYLNKHEELGGSFSEIVGQLAHSEDGKIAPKLRADLIAVPKKSRESLENRSRDRKANAIELAYMDRFAGYWQLWDRTLATPI
jgi:hypothetical protein